TEFSNPSTTSSITAATPGTRSSISRGKSCPSRAAIGQPQVTQSEDWYNVAVDTYIPPIHRDRLGRAVAWDAAADFYQLCGLVVADGRVQHLRFDVAEKPRAP